MISIIVPLYNYAHFIEENICSIQDQSYKDWEIIIVDDHSSDNPLSVIRSYLNDKIRYISLDSNVGYGGAKNIGIRQAKGRYIVVLDADDMLTKHSLQIRIKAMQKYNKLWCHAKAYEFSGSRPYNFVYKKRKAIKRLEKIHKIKKYQDLWKSIHAQTVMVHVDIYKQVGLYEPSLRSMGDKEMWARIINNVEKPLFIDKFVAYYRQHSMQMHRSKKKKKNLKKYEKILYKNIKKRKCSDLSDVPRLI